MNVLVLDPFYRRSLLAPLVVTNSLVQILQLLVSPTQIMLIHRQQYGSGASCPISSHSALTTLSESIPLSTKLVKLWLIRISEAVAEWVWKIIWPSSHCFCLNCHGFQLCNCHWESWSTWTSFRDGISTLKILSSPWHCNWRGSYLAHYHRCFETPHLRK